MINQKIYNHLKQVAKNNILTNYTETGALVGLKKDDHKLWDMLDEINVHEHQGKNPMLSSVVISPFRKMPGPGYFTCARRLGVLQGENEHLF